MPATSEISYDAKFAGLLRVPNTQRKFGEVGEDEGYVYLRSTDGAVVALFTQAELERATERALRHPEDCAKWQDMLGRAVVQAGRGT